MKKFLWLVVAVGAFMFLGGPAVAADVDDLVKTDGSDVLVSQEIINLISEFDPKAPVYAATDLNGWLVRGKSFANASRLAKTVIVKEGAWYRAKGLVGKRFHPAQVDSDANVRWAQIELLPGVDIDARVLPNWLDISAGKNRPCVKK